MNWFRNDAGNDASLPTPGDAASKVRSSAEQHFGTSGQNVERAGKGLYNQGSGAEQDRYGDRFSAAGQRLGDKVEDVARKAANYQGAGAEQDRYGEHFSRDTSKGLGPVVEDAAKKLHNLKGEGAEQERIGSHFSIGSWFGFGDSAKDSAKKANASNGSGAEQDRFGSHFSPGSSDGLGPAAERLAKKASNATGLGAEQDRYGSHFNQSGNTGFGSTVEKAAKKVYGAAGAEQDTLSRHFGSRSYTLVNRNLVQEAAQALSANKSYWGLGYDGWARAKELSKGGEQDRLGSHFGLSKDTADKAASKIKDGVNQATQWK